MVIGIIKEPDFESRISLLPEGVAELKKLNVETWVEKGAGLK
ncbi:MAG: NAD(P)(+) transhydrogenase (Re/Si-specific) subunit alpha, partial [Bacteroidetes bacterium CG_4_9_14_3_um_filter_41_19]